MRWFAPERRLRSALVEAMIPGTGAGLPALGELDLDAFWRRFDAVAPLHLAMGLRVAALTIGAALPRALGHAAGLDALSPDAREQVLQRAAALPLMATLLEVAKVVACLAYFDDDGVQMAVRGEA